MASSEQRLIEIISQVKVIYLDAKNKNFSQRLENYRKCNLLVEEASRLIDNLQNEITNMDLRKATREQIQQSEKSVEFLTIPNLRFDEAMYVMKDLRSVELGLPFNPEIIDHIEKQVVYEEQEVE